MSESQHLLWSDESNVQPVYTAMSSEAWTLVNSYV